MLVKLFALPPVLLATILFSACGDGTPTMPSETHAEVTALPPPGGDFSQLVGTWNLTVRLTAVNGTGGVADTMRSQIGVPTSYSMTITEAGKVTLRSDSRGYACTFMPLMDNIGFTTYGHGGYYTCEHPVQDFRCSDGTIRRIFTIGEDISGRLSGIGMNGTWDAVWFEMPDTVGVTMKAEFTGGRN